MNSIKKLGKGGLPKWWDYSFDYPFLVGADRFGLTRSDLFVEGLRFRLISSQGFTI